MMLAFILARYLNVACLSMASDSDSDVAILDEDIGIDPSVPLIKSTPVEGHRY